MYHSIFPDLGDSGTGHFAWLGEQRVEVVSPKPQSYQAKEKDSYLEEGSSRVTKENGKMGNRHW